MPQVLTRVRYFKHTGEFRTIRVDPKTGEQFIDNKTSLSVAEMQWIAAHKSSERDSGASTEWGDL